MEMGVRGAGRMERGWLGRPLARKPPMKPGAALRALAFNYGLPLMLGGAPDTLPIPDPSNFGLSGNSTTRSQRLAWLGTSVSGVLESLQYSAPTTQRTITELSPIHIAADLPSGGVDCPR